MPRPNRTRFAILGFLTWRAMSGYDIKKAVESSISNFWSESFGQIYPILKKLRDEGLAERQPGSGAGNRDRILYSITDKGRAALRRWLGEPTEPFSVRHELLLKLFFGDQSDAGSNRTQVTAFRDQAREDLLRYAQIRANIDEAYADHPERPYWLLTLRYGELERQAALDWCEEALAELDRLAAR